MARLPVLSTVGKTYRFVFGHLESLEAVSRRWTVAALIAFGFSWLLVFAASGTPEGAERFAALPPGQQAAAYMSLSVLIALLATYVIIVKWHRLIIRDLPPAETRRRALGAALLYFARSIFLGALLGAIVIALLPITLMRGMPLPREITASLPVVWVGAAFVGAVLAMARFSLILPAAAVGDHAMTLRRSWALTRANSWRVLLGSALASGPAMTVNVGLNAFFEYLPKSGADATTLTVVLALSLVLAVLTACIQASFLSYAYLFFVAHRASGAIRT